MQLKRIDPPKIDSDISNDFIADVISMASKNLTKQLDDAFIEGLKLKGYSFDSQQQLEEFIKSRCFATRDTALKETIYHVDSTPFMLYKEETALQGWNTNKLEFKGGSYSYL